MTVEARPDIIVLAGECLVEEAEALTAALVDRRRPVDISLCRQAHGAVVQALICLGAEVVGEPADPFLRDFVLPHLRFSGKTARKEDE